MDDRIPHDLEDVPEALDVPGDLETFDVVSLDGWGDTFIYNGTRPIIIPPDNHPDFLIELANNAYDFMNSYQEDHFNRMLRIKENIPDGYSNLPSTMLIWNIRAHEEDFVRYTNTAPHMANLLDPFFEHPTSPCVANEESLIRIDRPQDYDESWIGNIECAETRGFLMNMLTTPVLPPGLRCFDGAPIDVDGFPLTQHYVEGTDMYVPHGPHPAFTTINRDHPSDSIPSNLILQNWPTGPDERICRSNPLYQFAQPNVPMHEWELLELPDIHSFNGEFFEEYDMTPNIIAMAYRNSPHPLMDHLRDESNYRQEPPNINGRFTVLHHNFFREANIDDVYEVDPHARFNVLHRFNSEPNRDWANMGEEELMNHIDNAFIACQDTEERTELWTSMVPSLLQYSFVFCSICCCRLPNFYFTTSQRRMKRTRRACRHCEMNRNLKVSLVNRILGGKDYFQPQRECAGCHNNRSKYKFTNGQWRRNAGNRICVDCTV
jgi:hypothetical protein